MILALEEAKYRLENFRADIKELGSALRIDALRDRVKELEASTSDAAFWNDQENSGKVLREIKRTKDRIAKYEALSGKLEDTITLAELAIEENDESLVPEVETAEKEIRAEEESQRIEILLSGEYDQNNAILSFHPGAGGTEAQDWAQMLYRMYTRWGERHGYNVKLIDWLDGEEAGLKSATIMIEGENAYGYLKGENGVHRLVRVSPFDASGRRHTSFASVEVMPEFTDDGSIEINEADLEITTHKSSGAGGQHINKTESAVRITHLPTGLVVECQDERSQYKNKDKAMKILRSRLYDKLCEEQNEKIASDRRSQVGTGSRSERIRTYNFPESRLTDHRIGLTIYRLEAILNGALDEVIDALTTADQAAKLAGEE